MARYECFGRIVETVNRKLPFGTARCSCHNNDVQLLINNRAYALTRKQAASLANQLIEKGYLKLTPNQE